MVQHSSITTAKGCSMLPAEYRKINLLQQEISELNELACSYYETGELKSAVTQIYNGLTAVRRISKLKQELAQKTACSLLRTPHEYTDQSLSMRADEQRRPGSRLLPIDSDSNVWRCVHWETMSTVALLHNAAMIHFKARVYTRAKSMIDAARQTLHNIIKDKDKNKKSLPRLMESNKYAVTVVASLYTCAGRVMLRLSKSQQHDRCKSENLQAQAEKAFHTASSFLEQYQDKEEEGKRKLVSLTSGAGAVANSGFALSKTNQLLPISIPSMNACYSPQKNKSCGVTTTTASTRMREITVPTPRPIELVKSIAMVTPPKKDQAPPTRKAKQRWLDMLHLPMSS